MSISEVHVLNAKIRALKSKFVKEEEFSELLSAKSAEDVAQRFFPDIFQQTGENHYYNEFELRLYRDALKIFKLLVKYSDRIKPLTIALIQQYEIANLKKVVKGIIYPRYKINIKFHDITPYSSFNPRDALKCSDIGELNTFLSNTRYNDIIKKDSGQNTAFLIENRLDIFHYNELMKISSQFLGTSGSTLLEFLRKEINLINIGWALRLKMYYNLPYKELKDYIVSFPGYQFNEKEYEGMFDAKFEDEILSAIPRGTRIKIENIYEETFNKKLDYDDATFIDIEICIKKLLKKLYTSYLYYAYITPAPIIAFFKLKKIELNNLYSIVEGLRFNISKEEILNKLI